MRGTGSWEVEKFGSLEVGKVVRIRIYRILGFAGLEEESCQNARRIWSSTPQNRGLARIPQMTRIIGWVMAVGG